MAHMDTFLLQNSASWEMWMVHYKDMTMDGLKQQKNPSSLNYGRHLSHHILESV